jgi:hypothetical protein
MLSPSQTLLGAIESMVELGPKQIAFLVGQFAIVGTGCGVVSWLWATIWTKFTLSQGLVDSISHVLLKTRAQHLEAVNLPPTRENILQGLVGTTPAYWLIFFSFLPCLLQCININFGV